MRNADSFWPALSIEARHGGHVLVIGRAVGGDGAVHAGRTTPP